MPKIDTKKRMTVIDYMIFDNAPHVYRLLRTFTNRPDAKYFCSACGRGYATNNKHIRNHIDAEKWYFKKQDFLNNDTSHIKIMEQHPLEEF